jgi:NADH-quinone oxidoreductase subunit C
MPVTSRVTEQEALERVQGALGDKAVEPRINFGQVDIACAPEDLVEVATILRDDPGLSCRFFTFLSAVDRTVFGEEGQGLEVLVHLYSPAHVLHVSIHVPVNPAAPVCPSITNVFAGADWHERETHEMFGIHFDGHPNLSNLYLPEDFEGHPLLKSFKLPGRLVKEWPGAKDPDEAAAGGR